MRNPLLLAFVLIATFTVTAWSKPTGTTTADTKSIIHSGNVTYSDGTPASGTTISLFSPNQKYSVSVHAQEDGSFEMPPIDPGPYRLRTRLAGTLDTWTDIDGRTKPLAIKLEQATGWDLQLQRTGVDLISLLDWPNEEDALNFKMMCTYCHQVGTLGFRSPDEPVDWEVMLTRMDGYQGLHAQTKKTLVNKVVAAYGRDAEKNWPTFKAPAPPEGKALNGIVREWKMGSQDDAMIHDLEIGRDGRIYTVNMVGDTLEILDPATGEREVHSFPGGKEYGSAEAPRKGPHSIEAGPDGNMWITLALSGQMAMFDVQTNEFHIGSGHEAPRPRAGYPHTLRFAPNGTLWWTDAALGVFSLDPKSWDGKRWNVRYYKLPNANQVRGGGARGESKGIVPYGIDVDQKGHVWYTKLNGQRLGRIKPELADNDPNQITEWQPPVHGPRRLHVAPDGRIWVPGWASGNFASFEPGTEEWTVYDLPHGPDSLPYALNINQDGIVWICGTGTDSILRFDPKTAEFTEYRMPTQVTYTREIEFDKDGNPWTVNSNYPARHIEGGFGSIIQIVARIESGTESSAPSDTNNKGATKSGSE